MSQEFESKQITAIADKWGVVAIGREYPIHVQRRDGYRHPKAGAWYIIGADGEQRRANAAQARALNAVCETPYAKIGPIYATSR